MFENRIQARIQKFEADSSQRDGEAALRGSGIRGFVGQLCGERRNVHERCVMFAVCTACCLYNEVVSQRHKRAVDRCIN